MFKKGFTLSEMLISITIIGIVASVLVPMVNKVRPDETKIKYLKTYDAIASTMKDLAENKVYFPLYDAAGNYTAFYSTRPFMNTIAVDMPHTAANNDIAQGNGKMCRILSHVFADGQIRTQCANNYAVLSMFNGAFNPNFTTANGIDMIVRTSNANTENGNYQTDIYFDINGNELPNCFKINRTINTCPQPDRFKLKIASNGYIEPGDRIGNRYLSDRNNLRKVSSNPALLGDAAIENNALQHYLDGDY